VFITASKQGISRARYRQSADQLWQKNGRQAPSGIFR